MPSSHARCGFREKLFLLRLGTGGRPLGRVWAFLGGLLLAQVCWGGAVAWAGLAAADVAVVVNASSLNSRTLANHYVRLRGIPPTNVVVLEGVPSSEMISVEDFRQKILRPLLEELERRQLLGHLQCVAYSADFPTAIDIRQDLANIKELHQIFTPVASINALTYFYAQVLAGDPNYIGLNANFYARRPIDTYFSNPGGQATQAAWKEIEAAIQGEDFPLAADLLEKLFEDHPHQFPLAYLAAAQAAQAGDKPRALKLLGAAIAKGWNSRLYMKNDRRFDRIREQPQFQILELTLDETIKELQPASGFDARTAWTPNGVPVAQPQFGLRYLLSTVLGVTRGAGSSLPTAIANLQRAATADATHPRGTFYFTLTADVRTTTRQWGTIGAVDDLQKLGFGAEVISGVLPSGQADVLGLQFGTPSFDWVGAGSSFVPGAIADNLTSLGGVMTLGAGQTNLSELLKAGAAVSSGTVAEPYALQEKFPHPNLYVLYARGVSAAEAFYLSVTGPYQLLIVGDPLCQPFSHAPQPKFDSSLRLLPTGDVLAVEFTQTGTLYADWLEDPRPIAERSEPLQAVALRMLLDGSSPRQLPMQSKVNVSLQGLPPGYHRLDLQFLAEGPLALRSSGVVPVWRGPAEAIELNVTGAASASADYDHQLSLRSGKLVANVRAKAGRQVSLWHDGEQLAQGLGPSAEFIIPLERLGMGPVRLQAKVELEAGGTVASRPVWLEVLP